MPGITIAGANGMLDGSPLRQRVSHISLHTADNATGANEVTGGGYARVAVTSTDFAAASNAAITLAADQPFVGPANDAHGFFGIWDSGTFLGMGPITGDTAFNAEGDFILQAATSITVTTWAA
jgi:hypothetical protein